MKKIGAQLVLVEDDGDEQDIRSLQRLNDRSLELGYFLNEIQEGFSEEVAQVLNEQIQKNWLKKEEEKLPISEITVETAFIRKGTTRAEFSLAMKGGGRIWQSIIFNIKDKI